MVLKASKKSSNIFKELKGIILKEVKDEDIISPNKEFQ